MSSPEQWELADELLKQRMDHPALKAVKDCITELYYSQAQAFDRNENMKRIGVGRTEAPTFAMHVAEALEHLAHACMTTAKNIRRSLG